MPATISRKRFRRLLLSAVLVPLVVMLSVAGLLAWQVGRLLDAAKWVERNDQVIAQANESLKLTLDLETGLRGFLNSGIDAFLEPYYKADAVIEPASADLRRLVSDNRSQTHLLMLIDTVRAGWQQYAVQEIQLRRRGGAYASLDNLNGGKRQMDTIRELYRQFIATEDELRDVRSHTARHQSQITLWLVLAVGLLGGALLAMLSRRQFLEINSTYSEALATAQRLNTELETRVMERTQELQKRSDELREANRELEAFGYSISHDLRAPMRHISGFADLMRETLHAKLNGEEMELLDTIFDTARLAGRMVDDLLSFSRIGRTQLKLQPVDLNEIVARCRRDLEPDLRGRDVEWVIGPMPTVSADPTLMAMTFQNLLANAAKYTGKVEHARIEVGTVNPQTIPTTLPAPGESDLTDVPRAPSHLLFVRDNGVGFEMAFAGKLFGVFQRLHRSEDFEGTGIGLANVRRILTRHGGTVWAEGSLGQGATFYFTLPIDTPRGDEHESG